VLLGVAFGALGGVWSACGVWWGWWGLMGGCRKWGRHCRRWVILLGACCLLPDL